MQKTITYYFNTRYANFYNKSTRSYTFHLPTHIINAVSLKLNQFHLTHSYDLFKDVYRVNGYRTYEISGNICDQEFNKKAVLFNKSSLQVYSNKKIKIIVDHKKTVVFNNTNNDIAKAL